MKKLLLFLLFSASASLGYTQQRAVLKESFNGFSSEDLLLLQKIKNQPGTYSFEQLASSPEVFVVDDNILIQIEKTRKEHVFSFLQLNETLRVRIIPSASIDKKTFKPLKEFVSVKSFENH
jgi:hypothetical protein